MDIKAIQNQLALENLDGWLFYDFQNRDPIAYRILGLPNKHTSRRWFYFIPREGEPKKLCHSVEPTKLDPLPGTKEIYLPWQEMHSKLKLLLSYAKKIAMNYSPNGTIPYVSMVDAGTVELVRSFGVEVFTSANLIQIFESLVDEAHFKTHEMAGEKLHHILKATWQEIESRLQDRSVFTEYDIQQFMLELYQKNGLNCDHMPPIVAVNEHAGDPHFDPTALNSFQIKAGDALLIDLWARLDQPGAIYYDITWCGYIGARSEIPAAYLQMFDVAIKARNLALYFIKERLQKGKDLYGWEVDKICRDYIAESGYGPYFLHRTGHNIGEDVHGNGVNIDNLECKDERKIIPLTLFSIEPGIYMPRGLPFGVRTEIDVYVTRNCEAVVFGAIQNELVCLSTK